MIPFCFLMCRLYLLRGSRRRRPYLYRKRAIHRSRPAYSCSLEEAQGSIREGRPLPPLNPSNSFMSRRERRKRMTMSVWEQRTSQLRRHRQMSSREILFTNPTEEKDGPPASAQGRPLSLHRKVLENMPSGSLKHLKDPLASPIKSQDPVSSSMVDIPAHAEIPEPPESVVIKESLESTNTPLPDASESNPCGANPDDSQTHNTASGRQNPRLHGDRQHRAVKKFRPPDKPESLTPEMGDHDRIKGRRALHHQDHPNETWNQGSSNGNGNHLASRSVSRERKRNSGKLGEAEIHTVDEKSGDHESRCLTRGDKGEGGDSGAAKNQNHTSDQSPQTQEEPPQQVEPTDVSETSKEESEVQQEGGSCQLSSSVIVDMPNVQSSMELSTLTGSIN